MSTNQIPDGIFEHSCPDPVYYYNKQEGKGYIIMTPHSDDSNECYKFDIEKNKFVHFTNYPDGLLPDCHSQAIDQDNDLLYITHGQQTPAFCTYNFKTQEWNIFCNDITSAAKYNMDANTANCPLIVLPDSKLHVFRGTRTTQHIKYNESEKKWMSVSEKGLPGVEYLDTETFVFIKGKNILMVLGGYERRKVSGNTDKIWYSEYHNSQQTNFEWKLFNLKLPKPSSSVSCAVVFDMVLVILCANQFWVLDFDECQYKWIETKIENNDCSITGLIVSTDNYLHCVNRYESTHFKIHLSEFVPRKIYQKYQLKYLNLIAGYIKKYKMNEELVMPNELISVILRFYF